MDDIPEETKKENKEEAKHFFSDFDLWRYGYVEVGKENCRSCRCKKQYANEILRRHRENNPEKVKYHNHRCYEENKEKIDEQIRKYRRTEKGKIYARKRSFPHKQKGFIPRNDPFSIEFDWHHIHKELPFVMAIPPFYIDN